MSPSPRFRHLSDDECRALLTRTAVGRLAYSFHDKVDIVPIHFIFDGDQWLYGRTSPSAKLETLRHHRWVAFEVDDFQSIFRWQSVVVRGGFYPLSGEGVDADPAVVAHGVELLRGVVPDTFAADDPVEFRTVVFRIAIQEMTGRAAEER